MSSRIEAFYARQLKTFEMQLSRTRQLPDRKESTLPISLGIGTVSQATRRAANGGSFDPVEYGRFIKGLD